MKTNRVSTKAINAGLFGIAMLLFGPSAFAQVKIGTNPTTIEAASNLEVEASTAGRKVKVDKTTGQLTVKDGTEGNLRILTSDADGAAHWADMKNTVISSFAQTTGTQVGLPVGSSICGSLSCAQYLNWTGTFTTTKPVNDIVLDLTGVYTLATTTSSVQFRFIIAIDKTTPGTFEEVDNFFLTEAAATCGGNNMNYKTVLKDLPVRSYSVRVYAAPWTNGGTTLGILGVGYPSAFSGATPTCGVNNPSQQRLVISVSQ